MRRKRAFRRSRAISILIAAYAGYLIGSWNPVTALRSTALSAAQTVALRFPQDLGEASAATLAARAPLASLGSTMSDAQLALLDPAPMVPQAPALQAAAVSPDRPMPTQVATAEQAAPPLASTEIPPLRPTASALPSRPSKPVAPPVRRPAERPGFVLNDAQIASIKERLHLTPDQEQMWPAVEAALRNLAYDRAREAHRRGAAGTELAAADPNSPDVQGLKSAAIPLLMSFNSEQKDEVRSLAHVMGLDQLASQF